MKQVKCSLDDAQIAWVRDQAKKEQRSESHIIRQLVERARTKKVA